MRNCYALLLLSLLFGASTAQAQLLSAGNFPLTRQDTARAVHELFQSRRGGGFGWLAFGGAGMAASIIPAQQTTSAGVWTPGVVIGSALAVLGTKKVVQFGWGREGRVLRELAVTGHLPADVKRRLHGNFAPLYGTASQPDPFLATAAPRTAPRTAVVIPTLAAAPAPAAMTLPAPAPSAARLRADARTDTLDAVTGLFMARRSSGTWPLVILLPVARIMAGTTATTPASSPYAPQRAPPSDGAVAGRPRPDGRGPGVHAGTQRSLFTGSPSPCKPPIRPASLCQPPSDKSCARNTSLPAGATAGEWSAGLLAAAKPPEAAGNSLRPGPTGISGNSANSDPLKA